MTELTPEQRAIFDVEIESVRKRLGLIEAIGAIPTQRQRADAIKRLRVSVANVKRAASAKALQSSALFTDQIEAWLLAAATVADELKKVEENEACKTQQGMRRPNEPRQWLIGEQIPALFEKVYGKSFPATIGGAGTDFAHHVLKVLGEKDVGNETIKSLVSSVRREVRTKKTRM